MNIWYTYTVNTLHDMCVWGKPR